MRLIELGSFKKKEKLLEFKSTIDLNLVNRKRKLLSKPMKSTDFLPTFAHIKCHITTKILLGIKS